MSGAPGEAGGSAPPARPAVPATGETAPGGHTEKAEEREETGKRFRRIRLFPTGFSPAGLTGALACYCLSLTPSLIPRGWLIQAVVSGLTAAIGYGLGAFAGWLARSLIPWRPGAAIRRAARWALAAAGAILVPLFGVLGARWQHQIRDLTGADQPSETRYVLVAVAVAVALVGWQQLPAGHRPKLVVLGESLGSFGGEAAFSGADDIRGRTSGVLWVGPANSNVLWERFVAGRDPGSPEWRPVYEGGRTVRFAGRPADLDPDSRTWPLPRAVYLQNANDPIVRWSPSLAFHVPGWLKGALEGASAWASIIAPPGWTPERTAALARQPDD